MPKSDFAKSKSGECDIIQTGFDDIEAKVILAEPLLLIPVETDIKLPTYARDIKNIRKDVHLTQCKVLQDLTFVSPNRATLFVEGFVHKNIQYIDSAKGVLKDYNINVPFRCYDRIDLPVPPISPGLTSKDSSTEEYRQLAKNGMEADRCKFGSLTFEELNQPIDCKLLFSAVEEWDILKNFDRWSRFNKITEKINIILGLRITQKQPIDLLVNGAAPTDDENTENQESSRDVFRKLIRRA